MKKSDGCFGGDLLNCFRDGLGWVGGSGEDFQEANLAAIHPDTVGEGAAGIDSDAESGRALGHAILVEG
jgi:hypothetical protein